MTPHPRRSGALFKRTAGITPTANTLKAIRYKHNNAIAGCRRFRGPVCALRAPLLRVFEPGAPRIPNRRVMRLKMTSKILQPWRGNPLANAITFERAGSKAPLIYRCASQLNRWAAPNRGIGFERPISTLRPPGTLNLSGCLLTHDCLSFTAGFCLQPTPRREHSSRPKER